MTVWGGGVGRIEWRDLSDSELRNKLEQRDIKPALVEALVKGRDKNIRAAELIDDILQP